MSLLDGLEAYWKCDQTSGNRVDSHINGLDFIQTGFVGSIAGKLNLAVDGTGNILNILDQPSTPNLLFGDEAMAISVWANVNAGDTLTGWDIDVGTVGNFTIDDATTGEIYRDFDGDTSPKALLFETNATISQNFNNRRVNFDPDVPMYLQVAFRPNTATSGTVGIRLGNQTTTVVITTATTGWNVLRLLIGQANWFRIFNQENPTVQVSLTGGNGSVWIDDIVLARYQEFNGIWYAPVGGQTPFLRRDQFNFSHTNGDRVAGTQGLIQHWLWRIFNAYLPHTATTPSWTDPSV